ncbi:Aste57867_13845 [Aphanomyces stellatus]|uniref:Aste57867_13845 protein n=1 Tax=Aphanomyces stellatus TaxID=120398 RepID=A0A485KZV5_9STRA|nr:hypothetical protein As57867_013794 [Aphanomyces stellatus]VFT90676.1 Aste57867_13845 [Aphanomyces stellatus]
MDAATKDASAPRDGAPPTANEISATDASMTSQTNPTLSTSGEENAPKHPPNGRDDTSVQRTNAVSDARDDRKTDNHQQEYAVQNHGGRSRGSVDEDYEVNEDEVDDEDDMEHVPRLTKGPGRGRKKQKSEQVDLADRLLEMSSKLGPDVTKMYGQVTWNLMRGFPYWPGYICNPNLLLNNEQSMKKFAPLVETHYWVYFYGTNNGAAVLHKNVVPYDDKALPYREGYPNTKPIKKQKNSANRMAGFPEAVEIADSEHQLPLEARVSWVFKKVNTQDVVIRAKPGPKPGTKRPAMAAEDGAPPKKRRGRPPKVKLESQIPKDAVFSDDEIVREDEPVVRPVPIVAPAPPPKKRGRPFKVKPPPQEVAAAPAATEPVPVPVARPNGEAMETPPEKLKKKPGRKPKVVLAPSSVKATAVDSPLVTDTTAAPPAASPNLSASPRKKATALDAVQAQIDAPSPSPKRRGRPPKLKQVEVAPLATAVVNPEPIKKRRGRPPKSATAAAAAVPVVDNNTPRPVDVVSGETDGKDRPATPKQAPADESGDEDAFDEKKAKKVKKEKKEKKVKKDKKEKKAKRKHSSSGDDDEKRDDGEEKEEKKAKVSDVVDVPPPLSAQVPRKFWMEKLDVEKAKKVVRRLKKGLGLDSKENNDTVLQIMHALLEVKEFTLDLLKDSGLPLVVNQLRDSTNPNVAKTASALRKHMMNQSGYEKNKSKPPKASAVVPSAPATAAADEMQPTSSETVAPSAHEESTEATPVVDAVERVPEVIELDDADDDQDGSVVENGRAKKPNEQEPENFTTPEEDDSAAHFSRERELVIEMIQTILSSDKMSREIEMALYDRFSDTTEEYKTQARRIIFGLRDHEHCRKKVMTGALHVLELVFAEDEAFTNYNMVNPSRGK